MRSNGWKLGKRNWTRNDQKNRVLMCFKLRYQKGKFDEMTSVKLANELQIVSSDYLKEILDEMAKEGTLVSRSVLHQVRRDKSQIWKSLYKPSTWLEQEDAFMENERHLNQQELL
jgi:hypothetical protein